MATPTEENAQEVMKRKWSDLPIDIVGNVIGKLGWADRVRFSAVCKAWHQPLRGIPTIEEYPWLLSFNYEEPRKRVMKLLDPHRKKSYIVQEFRGEEAEILDDYFFASRYGWIMYNKTKKLPDCVCIFSTFLFSPFTRRDC